METVEERIDDQLPIPAEEPAASEVEALQAGEPAGEGEMSMEALLAGQDELQQKLSGKQVVWVKVISTTKDYVLVDVGEKNEGAVPVAEFDGEGDRGERKLPAAGQRIPVLRAGPGRRDGHTILSYKRARAETGWIAALKSFQEKARVRGRVTAAIKGGYLVNVNGVTAFLPASLADLHPVRSPARMVNTGVRCYIIEVNEAKRQLVLSRKAVLEDEAAKRRAQLMIELRVGEVRIGRVLHVGANGVAVDIGGVEGAVRMSDVSWGLPKLPVGLERGSKVKVKVLSKPADDKSADSVLLGMKQLTPNPADSLRRKFPPKTVVKGKVAESSATGLKLALEGGAAAFCAAADCGPLSGYKAGDPISAVVLSVNSNTFELLVSVNKFDEIRDRKRMAQYLKAPPPLTLGQLLSPEKND
jgi:ribosomal protein S1